MTELGERLFLDSGTLTPLLKRMKNNGLAHRIRSGEDERKVFVRLTEKAKVLKKKAYAIPEKMLKQDSFRPDLNYLQEMATTE